MDNLNTQTFRSDTLSPSTSTQKKGCQGYGCGVEHHYQQYFSYIMAVSFIGG
jgi:hypothetical protein